MDNCEGCEKIERERKDMINLEIKNVEDAVKFLNFAKDNMGIDSVWSIQYWGFGEHFTHWRGDGTFIDFNIDKGQGISWDKMKEILIKSAKNLQELLRGEPNDENK